MNDHWKPKVSQKHITVDLMENTEDRRQKIKHKTKLNMLQRCLREFLTQNGMVGGRAWKDL
jgi:hypothetical protein